MRQIPLFVPLMAALLLTAGCVVSQEEFSSMQSRLANQQEAQHQLEQRVAKLNAELASARSELKQEISQSSTPVRSTQANLWAEVEQLKMRIATMQGRVDSLEQTAGQLEDRQSNATAAIKEMGENLTAMRMVLESQLALDFSEARGAPPAKAPAATAGSEEGLPDTAQAADPARSLYDNALNLFKQRRYQQAQAMWADFAQSYPDHQLVPNAIFWQGECFYQMEDYSRAILSYQEVITKYPKSTKYAPSLLKQGIAFLRLGKEKAGRLVLQDLVDKLPDSPEAARAKAILQK